MRRLLSFFIKSGANIKKKPLYLQIASAAALLSLFSLLFSDLSLVYDNFTRARLSLLDILSYGSVNLSANGNDYSLSFAKGIPFLFGSGAAAACILFLFFFYEKIAKKCHTAVITGGVILLTACTLFLRLLAVSFFISPNFLEEAKIPSSRLYLSPGLVFNVLSIIFIGSIVCSLLSLLGIRFQMRMLAWPYFLWILIFTIIPLLLIILSAFLVREAGGGYVFSLDGFHTLLSDKPVRTSFYGISLYMQEYFSVFLRSLDYALWTTFGCLAICYPLGYFLAAKAKRSRSSNSWFLMMSFILPMWINTLLRTYAWRSFFGQTGVLNNILLGIGLISEPILFLKDAIIGDIVIKMVLINDFLPFMLMPIYSVLVKLDDNVSHAAHDLGANEIQTFRKVIFPLSMPGVISGIQMVFMPSLTFYMIPDIMSEGSITTIGMTVQNFVLNESLSQQRAGNVLSLLLLLFVLFTMGILRNADKDQAGGGLAL